ncbi:MAG: SAM-dependent methyltransferase [Bacilli bacterium]|nr:SAM-dependent methyltransferase [Bacilli bacterium]
MKLFVIRKPKRFFDVIWGMRNVGGEFMGSWFPKVYDRFMKPLEHMGLISIRKQLTEMARGKVLEIGSGTGMNFSHYKNTEVVIAIEPDQMMINQSLERRREASVNIEIIRAEAENLPFADNSFDNVIGTLVFCTIPDPLQALLEIRRVCKPGGKLLLMEHVRVNDSMLGHLQDWLTPIWKPLCGGCHLNRDTLNIVKQTGFSVVKVQHYANKIFLVIEALNTKYENT